MHVEYVVVSAPLVAHGPSEDAVAVSEGEPFVAVVADGHGREVDEQGCYFEKSTTVAQFAQDVATGVCERVRYLPHPGRFPKVFDQVSDVVTRQYRPLTERVGAFAQLHVGAVASCVLVQDNTIHLAQTGDCRLLRTTSGWKGGFLLLSRDHNCDNIDEVVRLRPLLQTGAFRIAPAVPSMLLESFPNRGFDRLFRRNPDTGSYTQYLEPTRVFGDWEFLPAVTHEPECREFPFSSELYALCSDGGSWVVKETFASLRGQTQTVSLEHVKAQAELHLKKLDDDVVVVFFRKKT